MYEKDEKRDRFGVRKMKSLLVSTRDKIDDLKWSGIYEIECVQCAVKFMWVRQKTNVEEI